MPIPPQGTGKRGRPSKYPLRDLHEGDSILLREEDGYDPNAVACSVRYHNLRFRPMHWTYRSVQEGVRVWRTD